MTGAYTVYQGSVRNIAIDCSKALDSGELMTGTPTITVSPAGVTLSNKAISSETLSVLSRDVGAGLVATCTATCTDTGTYTITVQADTDASQTIIGKVSLVVEA